MTLPDAAKPQRLAPPDFILLALFCLGLFGFQMFSGRPLSLHEARLPECSREMLSGHNWLFPQSGGRPWLERPPLPQWIEVGVSVLLGQHCDKVWVVRLPSVLMGLSIVLMTAWMASVFFGRTLGLLSGFVLATTYEFYAYAILAEDDIFLAAFVALAITLFVSMEFGERRDVDHPLIGNRPWQVWGFFIVLGLSNLVKGPLVGAAVVIGPTAVYVLASWPADWLRIRRYAWVWGALFFGLMIFAWNWAAAHRYPELYRNLKYDYQDTNNFDKPIWYYPKMLAGLGSPWILFAAIGLAATALSARRNSRSPERFLWCWAVLPIIILSIPHRKHHHYLLPSLAPWAIFAAVGLGELWKVLRRQTRSIPHALVETLLFGLLPAIGLLAWQHFVSEHLRIPASLPAIEIMAAIWFVGIAVLFNGLLRRRGAVVAGAGFCIIAALYCWGQINLPDMTTQDTRFLARVEAEVPRDQILFVNGDLHGEMDFFRNQFYLRPDARLLHNLSYLRDEQITALQVWIVTRYIDRSKLEQLGEVEVKAQSEMSRRENDWAKLAHLPPSEYRFTLFLLRYKPDLQRYPRPPYIGTLQAMGREAGPYCGPPL